MLERLRDGWLEILNIQKFRRVVSYTGFYCFVTLISYAYTNNTTRAGYSRADQFYASYPAGTELLTDTGKRNGGLLNGAFWLNILNARGNHRMHITHNIWHTWPPWGNWMEAAS